MATVTEQHQNVALLRSLARTYQKVARLLTAHHQNDGVTPSQWETLALLHHRGRQSVNQLMEAMVTSSGNFNVVLCNLERHGLVKRVQDQEDRRVRWVTLTEKGAQLFLAADPAHQDYLVRLTAGLTSEEKGQLKALLKKLSLAMDGVPSDEYHSFEGKE